ncbi:MAG TPA: valine--tRNA ligase [Tepidisphaeraceae bacterium]|jgi:valyl-tRNA synthetase|nr:valine--tRNA ligase [Tepidisphaeraceae bacterium]
MSTELSKTYDPSSVEPLAYQTWLDEKCFTPDPANPGPPYCIVIPPPNVTGALHLGHAINNTLQDILTRVHRMRGFNTLWVPGLDHAGIATQAVVEKQLKEKENKTRHDVGREALVDRIWTWKQQYGDRILSQLQRLGASCDWSRTRFTLDDMCAKAVRETFFKLFKDGLIYRGKRLVNWDTHLHTSISDDELYTEPTKTNLWHIKYPIVEESGTGFQPVQHGLQTHATEMTIATTRPETMLADTAVAVHPDDPRWNWAIGKSVRLPLTNRLIPIIADPILVDMTFGSGAVKVTPAHDPNDYAVYQRHLGTPTEIAILNLMTHDGRVNDAHPSWSSYSGLTFAAARKKIVEDLLAQGFMTEADIKPHEANVSFSDRSKTAIQPYLSDQWFVKMAPLAEPALEAVRTNKIKFHPERHAQQYLSWLGEKRDWPISRQLWWGHRIPVWTVRTHLKKGYISNESAAGLASVLQKSSESFVILATENGIRFDVALYREDFLPPHPFFDYDGELTIQICIRESNEELEAELAKAGFIQDPDVLDTWFSSALWPHSTLGWPEKTPDLAKWYPTSVLLTGRDIITLWVARMVMTGIYNMGDIPFTDVAINPTILDEYGKRMSKTAGNGVDPVDIIDTHGADALRLTLTTMATETQDARMPVKIICPKCQTLITNPESNKIPTVTCPKCKTVITRPLGTTTGTPEAPLGRMTSDKFDFGRNFCTKLWNASRFILSNLETTPPQSPPTALGGSLSLPDQWILSRFNRTIAEANEALANFRFDQYARACYTFFWDDLCDWYIEASKPAMKDPARAPQTASILAALLDGTLRLLHPIIPFITETIWWRLNEVRPTRGLPGQLDCPPSKRLINAPWPAAGPTSESAEHVFPKLQAIVGTIRNLRNDYKADPKKPVTVSISPPGDEAARATSDNRQLIELLAICTITTIQPNLPQPANSARGTANGNCDIYVEGLIDPDAEKQRNQKRKEELTSEIASLKARLSNEGYVAKAPVKLVEQSKARLAEAEAELAKLG